MSQYQIDVLALLGAFLVLALCYPAFQWIGRVLVRIQDYLEIRRYHQKEQASRAALLRGAEQP